MASHIAFLRAVNVAGHARVAMADVVRAFEKAGCRGVKSYGHAGNLFWTGRAGLAKQPRRGTPVERVRVLLEQLLGESPGIMVRTRREMAAIVAADPFGALVHDTTIKLYVVFLERKPKQVPPLPVVHVLERVELIAVRGREAYLASRRKPNGFYGFPNQFIEKTLGMAGTTRNWSTVTKVAALMEQA
jgi:uncharacterized protein (DUF1697 family)